MDFIKFQADVSAVINDPHGMRAFGIRCKRVLSELDADVIDGLFKGMSIENSVKFRKYIIGGF